MIHPAVAPVSLTSLFPVFRTRSSSGGQNLAASCTAAGQDLTAIGGSHSLAETVDLGTVTIAGLVGTLHSGYTSCIYDVHMLDSLNRPQQRVLGRLSQSCLLIIP